MRNLKKIQLPALALESGKNNGAMPLFFEQFGPPIGDFPIVLVNHALTGNSTVTGENGWWNDLIGDEKTIDTRHFTILAFNIPGNGYDENPENLIANYRDFSVADVARFFWKGLDLLEIESVFAVIGGSLGGAIAWEMAAQQPDKIQNLIPIATDWKATDWVLANVLVQDKILNNSDDPVADARHHAMLLYRTPESLNQRFQRETYGNSAFAIESWLGGHGVKLKNRFRLPAYKLMNHLLKTIDITKKRGDFVAVAKGISANIHLIAVDTDWFFTAQENQLAYQELKPVKPNVFYHEIASIHGHDAFLIESAQLSEILKPIFKTQKYPQYAT